MSDSNATHHKHIVTAKERLAGVKAGQAWIQEVLANHLQHLSSVYDAAQQPVTTTTEPEEAAP